MNVFLIGGPYIEFITPSFSVFSRTQYEYSYVVRSVTGGTELVESGHLENQETCEQIVFILFNTDSRLFYIFTFQTPPVK